MNRIPLRSAAVALLLVLGALMLLPNAAYAQASSGTLTGRVTDDTGAALPGVTVTATDVNTGYNRVVVTGGDGVYRLGSIPVGTYTVAAELSGFAITKVSGVRASVATGRMNSRATSFCAPGTRSASSTTCIAAFRGRSSPKENG